MWIVVHNSIHYATGQAHSHAHISVHVHVHVSWGEVHVRAHKLNNEAQRIQKQCQKGQETNHKEVSKLTTQPTHLHTYQVLCIPQPIMIPVAMYMYMYYVCVCVCTCVCDIHVHVGPGFDSRWLPCDFLFQQLTPLCLQTWMMSMSALVQFGCYHWCSSTGGCYHQCSSTVGCYHS